MNWKKYRVGDIVEYSWNEFDGKGKIIATVTQVEEDHAIAEADDMKLWIDNDTVENFRKL